MSVPQPLEKLHDGGPPPFLTKTYDIVDDPNTDPVISWSKGNNSFVVWDLQTFSITLLPRYFKHSNFSSFIRQLNTYGFRKVDADRWEFANEGFLRGKKHLLKNITRRKSSSPTYLESCVEVGSIEIDRLKRDKKVLMVELVKLRQQQQTSRNLLEEMEQRLQQTEMKQRQMMNFLAKAMKNPDFVQQMLQNNDTRKEIEENNTVQQGGGQYDLGSASNVKFEIQEINNTHHFEEFVIDDGLFWEGLLSEDKGVEGVTEQLGYLGSSSWFKGPYGW